MQKLLNLFEKEPWDALIVILLFGCIEPAAWKVFGQFPRELSPKEANSYDYLLQHEYINVTQKDVRAKLKDPQVQ